MSSETDKQILGDLIDVNFEAGETIKMVCQPHVKSFYLNEIRGILIVLLAFGGVFVLGLIIAYLSKNNYDWRQIPFILGVLALCCSYGSLHTTKEARKTSYIITDLSIVIYKDLRNPRTTVINLEDIQTKELTKTFIDKYLGTGTIKIFTGEMGDNDGTPEKVYNYLSAVTEPEKVFAFI